MFRGEGERERLRQLVDGGDLTWAEGHRPAGWTPTKNGPVRRHERATASGPLRVERVEGHGDHAVWGCRRRRADRDAALRLGRASRCPWTRHRADRRGFIRNGRASPRLLGEAPPLVVVAAAPNGPSHQAENFEDYTDHDEDDANGPQDAEAGNEKGDDEQDDS